MASCLSDATREAPQITDSWQNSSNLHHTQPRHTSDRPLPKQTLLLQGRRTSPQLGKPASQLGASGLLVHVHPIRHHTHMAPAFLKGQVLDRLKQRTNPYSLGLFGKSLTHTAR